MQDEAAVDVDQGRPEVVALADEHLPRAGEELKRAEHFALPAHADGEVGERLRRLVRHLQGLEAGEGLLGQGDAFLQEVQLEVELRLVEVAERAMVGVTQRLRARPRGLVELEGQRVLAPQVMQIGDVVVGLHDQAREPVRFAERSRFAMDGQGLGEVVQADVAHRHVTERDGHVVGRADFPQRGLCALVQREGLREPVAAIVEVRDVDVQTCEAEPVPQALEDGACAARVGFRFRIASEVDQGLEGARQRATDFRLVAHSLVHLAGGVVGGDGGLVLAARIQDVGGRAPRPRLRARVEAKGQPGRRLRQPFGAGEGRVHQARHLVGQGRDDGGAEQLWPLLEEPFDGFRAAKGCDLLDDIPAHDRGGRLHLRGPAPLGPSAAGRGSVRG